MNEVKAPASRLRVEKYLEDKLRECAPGERLPSIRQIRSECGVSQSVVDKVIMKLLSDEQIKIRRPAGLFKAEAPTPSIKILNFHADITRGSFYHEFLTELLYVLADDNRQLEIIPVEQDLNAVLSESKNVTYFTFGLRWQDYASVRDRIGDGVIHLLPNFLEPVSPSLIIDDTELVKTQLKHLVDNGHRRVAYLHLYNEKSYVRAQNTRWEAFHRIGFENGLEFDKNYLIGCSSYDRAVIVSAVTDLFKLPNAPTAVLMASDKLAPCAYEGIRAAGLEPGRDVAVIGTNNRAWCEFLTPKLSSAGFDFENAFESLIVMLKEIEAGDSGRVIRVPAKLYPRISTKINI